MSASIDPGPDLSVDRYGRGHRRPWVWRTFVVVALAVGIGWAWWVADAQSSRPIGAQVESFTIVSAHTTRVDLRVDRTQDVAGTCDVYAMASDHAIVGERRATIPAGDGGTIRVPVEITTDRAAVNVALRSCAPTE